MIKMRSVFPFLKWLEKATMQTDFVQEPFFGYVPAMIIL